MATARALQLYAIGLVGYSIVRIISPTFYALQRSRIPVMVSAASVVVNVGLNLSLVRVHGLSRPRARHLDHGAHQCVGAVMVAAP